MKGIFTLKVSSDCLKAVLDKLNIPESEKAYSTADLIRFIEEEGVTFGLNDKLINEICDFPNKLCFPLVIAEGIPAKDGMDAYLVKEEYSKQSGRRNRLNYLNDSYTSKVDNGSIIATVIPATPGFDGMNVYGETIRPKPGGDLKIEPGKNVIRHQQQFFSLIDGEISLTDKFLSVNPVHIVEGDLVPANGKLQFNGNVIITGNVSTGCQIEAEGDIKIYGMVENSTLLAEGNIIISGGISGGNSGLITAKGNINVNYLNQAIVKAGENVYVHKSILHSDVEAKGSILSHQAVVIGGSLSSRVSIHVKDAGNHSFTNTVFNLLEVQDESSRLNDINEELIKLNVLINKLIKLEEKSHKAASVTGRLSEKQRHLLMKQKTTKQHLLSQISKLTDEHNRLKGEIQSHKNVCLYVYGSIYPHVKVNFGKYAKNFKQKHKQVKVFFYNREFVVQAINVQTNQT